MKAMVSLLWGLRRSAFSANSRDRGKLVGFIFELSDAQPGAVIGGDLLRRFLEQLDGRDRGGFCKRLRCFQVAPDVAGVAVDDPFLQGDRLLEVSGFEL